MSRKTNSEGEEATKWQRKTPKQSENLNSPSTRGFFFHVNETLIGFDVAHAIPIHGMKKCEAIRAMFLALKDETTKCENFLVARSHQSSFPLLMRLDSAKAISASSLPGELSIQITPTSLLLHIPHCFFSFAFCLSTTKSQTAHELEMENFRHVAAMLSYFSDFAGEARGRLEHGKCARVHGIQICLRDFE